MVLIDCSNANIYYIINMLVCFKSIIRQYWTPFDPPFQTIWHSMSEALKGNEQYSYTSLEARRN